jgi:hypothetical protein
MSQSCIGARALISATAKSLLVVAGTALWPEMPASAQTAEPTVEGLQKQLRQRDALIQSLVRRVEKLERRMENGTPAAGGPPAAVTRAVARSAGGSPAATPTEVALHPEEAPPAPMTAQAAPPPPTSQPAASQPPSAPAPGQFEVSEETAERALERTLVATGNQLVPLGFAEVEPLFSYTRREATALVAVATTGAAVNFGINRNELVPAVDVRVGLPWESQFEMFLPWNFQEQQTTNNIVQPVQQVDDRWGNAIGDLSVGAAKTFVHESGWIPSLLGRVSYEIPTGPLFANRTPLTGGQSRLSMSLTAVKRQDPLVFIGTGGYTKSFQSNQINPGDQSNFAIGTFLATSPETTLRGVLSQTFLQNVTVRGVTFPGSNTVQSLLTFGASSILGRGVLVDLQVGFGLTNPSPKYTVVLSSTWRFGVTGQ